MDKIIQNGIDVSKCEFYQKVNDESDQYDPCNQWGDSRTTFCSENPNCNFKQSAIKEEKLKQAIIQYESVVEQNRSLQKSLKLKEQECEKLMEENKAYNIFIKKVCENIGLEFNSKEQAIQSSEKDDKTTIYNDQSGMIVREIVREKSYDTKCKICIDGYAVYKCQYLKRHGLELRCGDYSAKGIYFAGLQCSDRDDCAFKNSFVANEEDKKLLNQLDRALQCRIPFGKYKGKTIEELLELDVRYLHWLLGIPTRGFLFDSLCLCAFIINYKFDKLPQISLGGSCFPSEGGGDLHYWGEPLLDYGDLC